MAERKLNVDIPKAIQEFESLLKKFYLKEKLYKTVFRGRGLEFDGYREYSPDEDSSEIDWKASVRTNRVLVRKYIEERNLKVIFAIDVSENMVFGSTEKVKCEFAVEVAAAFAHLISSANDEIGFLLFNKEVLEYIPPRPGTNQFSYFTHSISNPMIYGDSSNIRSVIGFLLESIKDVNAIVLISDFSHFSDSSMKDLTLLGNKTEVISIIIKDPLDKTLPNMDGEIVLEDSLTGQQVLVNPKIARAVYERNVSLKDEKIRRVFEDSNVDFVELLTSKDFSIPLSQFLIERIRKGRIIR